MKSEKHSIEYTEREKLIIELFREQLEIERMKVKLLEHQIIDYQNLIENVTKKLTQ